MNKKKRKRIVTTSTSIQDMVKEGLVIQDRVRAICKTPNECVYPNCKCERNTFPPYKAEDKAEGISYFKVGGIEPQKGDELFYVNPTTPDSHDGRKSKPLDIDEVGMLGHIGADLVKKEHNLTVHVVSEKQPIIIRVTHEGVYSNLHGKYFDVAHGELNVEGLNRID